MQEKIVHCSFCGKGMECPANMLDSDKHACFGCFRNLKEMPGKGLGKVHVEVPKDKFMSAPVISTIMEEAFNKVWNEFKSEFKGMSKKEIAREMFDVGAQGMFQFLMDTKKMEKEKRGEI